MGHRPILLADAPPTFTEKGGLFYVDIDIADAPLLAFTPHDTLAALRALARIYAAWAGCAEAEVPSLAARR